MGKYQYLWIIGFLLLYACQKEVSDSIDYVKLLNRQPDSEISVITCDKPWEKELSFPTIISLPDKYIMYYITYNGLSSRCFCTCYAESSDGIHWIKPELGLVEFEGNKNNNIISLDFEGISVEYHQGVFYLLSYAVDFKTYLYKSLDGVIFTKVESFDIPYCCDSQNQILWDPASRNYKIYLRSWYKSKNKNIKYNHTDSLYRAVSLLEINNPEVARLLTNDDPFWRWGISSGIPPALSDELPIIMQNTSNEDYDIYNSCVHIYQDGTFIAYPILYWHLPEPPQGGSSYNDGYTRLGMWYSQDGKNFNITTNDYFNFGGIYFEFALGHIETKEEIMHYYVKFSKTHGDTYWDNKSEIIARIHYK